jgi:hypothetical protein
MSEVTEYLKEIGRKGGNARSQSLSSERKASIARNAADIRWADERRKKRLEDKVKHRDDD